MIRDIRKNLQQVLTLPFPLRIKFQWWHLELLRMMIVGRGERAEWDRFNYDRKASLPNPFPSTRFSYIISRPLKLYRLLPLHFEKLRFILVTGKSRKENEKTNAGCVFFYSCNFRYVLVERLLSPEKSQFRINWTAKRRMGVTTMATDRRKWKASASLEKRDKGSLQLWRTKKAKKRVNVRMWWSRLYMWYARFCNILSFMSVLYFKWCYQDIFLLLF